MAKTAAISAAKQAAKVGRVLPVIIDEVGEADEDGSIGATGRSQADAPEIDGHVYLRDVPEGLAPGAIVNVAIEDADEHDLFGAIANCTTYTLQSATMLIIVALLAMVRARGGV